MIKIIKEEIEIDESLVSRLNVICDFCNTTPIIENGSIRKIQHTNLTYIEPHRIIIKGITFLAFNYSNEIYVHNLGVLYVKEDNGTLLENVDDVFKLIPAECDGNVVYSKESILVESKHVPYYENEENSDDEISSLKSKIKDLKDSLDYWKDKFQRVIKFIHDKIHGIFGDKDDKYKEMADNLFINGIMDEKEYTSVINKKEKNRDDYER
ncbi:MAG: hypothetical protein VZS44_01440 [Bacilli bacterium]|nr:hypothetical protein [Bacilli bacterium]